MAWELTGNAGTNPATNFLGTSDNQPLVIRTNRVEQLRITQGGNVGVGTTTPRAKLDLPDRSVLAIGGVAVGGWIRFNNDANNQIAYAGREFGVYTNQDNGIRFYTGGSNFRAIINNDGNVGIGTPGPDAKLHVSSGDGFASPQVHITQTTQDDFARLRFNNFTTGPDGDRESGNPWDIAVGGDSPGRNKMNFFVEGVGNVMTLQGNGNVGIGTEFPQARLDVVGDIHATGSKNFVQAHPTDPTKEIVYATLEGSEAGTYTRGTWKLDNGKAVIKLPEHFGLVTGEAGLTVQFTPRGEWLQLYVVQVNTHELIVRETQGKSGQFDYLIQGVRKGYEHHEVIQERK